MPRLSFCSCPKRVWGHAAQVWCHFHHPAVSKQGNSKQWPNQWKSLVVLLLSASPPDCWWKEVVDFTPAFWRWYLRETTSCLPYCRCWTGQGIWLLGDNVRQSVYAVFVGRLREVLNVCLHTRVLWFATVTVHRCCVCFVLRVVHLTIDWHVWFACKLHDIKHLHSRSVADPDVGDPPFVYPWLCPFSHLPCFPFRLRPALSPLCCN